MIALKFRENVKGINLSLNTLILLHLRLFYHSSKTLYVTNEAFPTMQTYTSLNNRLYYVSIDQVII